MNHPLLALAPQAPPGFESRTTLERRDVRRGVFALFADSIEAAETALAPHRGQIAGIVVTLGAQWRWEDRGGGVFHFTVPAAMRSDLPVLLQPQLQMLGTLQRLEESRRAFQLELTRAAEDRSRVVREFSDLRASLLKEIGERRAAEAELKGAHDLLEVRVRERTAELAAANAALESEIAERRRADLALAEQRRRFNTLMESVPERIYFKDAQSRFVQVNHALARLFGLASPDEAVGRTDFDFFSREHAQPAYDDEQEVMRTGEAIIGKIERETLPDGSSRWGLTSKMPLRDVEGRIVGTFGLTRDITEIKNAEDELRSANERLREVLADLTRSHEELKRAQLQLIQAEKMQSVGRLAAGVAHEVKNPLQILEMGLGCLAASPPAGDEQFPMIVSEMREAVARATAVVHDLLDFSSSKELDMRATDLNGVVENALRFVRHELITHRVDVHRKLDPALPPCRVDPRKIEQVLINVFINACQAMSDGGGITVTTGVRKLGGDDVKWEAGDRSGTRFRQAERVVCLEVRDTGPGIAPEQLGQVFEPFFTTKPTGKGTGLGLTVARKIIDLHDGRLTLENAPGGGAVVTILFKLD